MQQRITDVTQPGDDQDGFPARWLSAFRVIVVVSILLHITLFVISVPADFKRRLDEITESETDIVERIASAGLSREFFAGYLTGITTLCGVLFVILALLIFVRRSHSFMPLFVTLVLITEGTQIGGLFYALETIHSAGRWVAEAMDILTTTLLVMFFFLFPSGHFVPRWTRWVTVGVVLAALGGLVLAALDPEADHMTMNVLFFIPVFGTMVYAQIYRYRRIPVAADRQKVKWVVVGMTGALGSLLVAAVATILNPDRGPLAIMFWFSLANIGFVMIPLAITIAILRYQLFDIDRLINRTLVYATLSAILGATYFVSVFLLQSVLGSIAGSSGLAVALSTLVAVAMFRPARDGVQHTVDRRFYRTRYDAEEILGGFSRSVRDEVDLDRLQSILSATIVSAIRPEHVSIWLEPLPGRERAREQVLDADD